MEIGNMSYETACVRDAAPQGDGVLRDSLTVPQPCIAGQSNLLIVFALCDRRPSQSPLLPQRISQSANWEITGHNVNWPLTSSS